LLFSRAGSAQPTPSVTFQLSNHTNAPGDAVTARMTVGGFAQVTSVQFTLQWDPTVLRYIGTGGFGLPGLGAGNFGTTLTNSGKLTFSWDDLSESGVTVADGTIIFTVSYVVTGSAGSTSPLALTGQPTSLEVAVDLGLANLIPVDGQVQVVAPTSRYSVDNTNLITINDYSPATPYPAAVMVSNVAGEVSKATVTLHGLGHAWPDDIGVLLVGPQGQKIELMADAGSSQPIAGVTITFDDDAAAGLSDAPIVSGTYKPGPCGSGDTFAPPAPAGPYATALSAVTGGNPNGAWSLYVQDDAPGDSGSITGGWTLTLSLAPPPPSPVFLPGTLKHFSNGQFECQLAGSAGSNYEIQASADLRNWKVLRTLSMTNSPCDFLDTNTNVVRRFYRARLVE